MARPPSLTRALMRTLLPEEFRESLLGDLDEEFRNYVSKRMGGFRARWWYRSQAWRSLLSVLLGREVHRSRSFGQSPAWLSHGVTQDARFALRNLVRSPGFALLTLLMLGLGIGANTAIFSAVNEVMFRPLTVAEQDRLVMLWESNVWKGWDRVHAAPANVLDWRERVDAFQDVAFLSDFETRVALSLDDGAVDVPAALVSGNLFRVLGVEPQLGRSFRMEETWQGSESLVMLSHSTWQNRYSGDPDMIGRTISIDGLPYEVLGVMGSDFRYPFGEADLWVTYQWPANLSEIPSLRRAHIVRAVARLVPGATRREASSQLAAVAEQLQQEHPELNRGMEAGLSPLQSFLVGDRRQPLVLLLAAVVLLQLVATVNVANLFLVKALERRNEIAVRAALGAGRWRLMRQMLTESAVVASLGMAVGLGLGYLALRYIAALEPPGLPDLQFRLDWRVAAFTAGVTFLSAIVFGLAPAIRAMRVSVRDELSDGSRTGSIRKGVRTAGALVAAEVALALMLAVGAGLMLRTLAELSRVEIGADIENILTFRITPPQGSYRSEADRAEFAVQLVERLQHLPGVAQAGAGRRLPLTGYAWSSDFAIEGWEPDRFGVEVRHREATQGYFRALNVPLLEGSLFPERLAENQTVPVVVNRAFAERYFPEESPVGRRVAFDRHPTDESYWYEIVGVVGNERMDPAGEPIPEIISHFSGDTPRDITIVLKTEIPPTQLVDPARAVLAELDDAVPLSDVNTMEQVAFQALARERFLFILLGIFSAVGLALAAVGIYAVSAQAVKVRVREIGIRMALGASGAAVTAHLLSRGARFVLLGVALGLAGALAGGRVMRSLLFQVSPWDPLTLGSVAALLIGVASIAAYLPTRRAAGLDPARVLRE